MVSVDKAILARLKVQGHTFEILVDCDHAIALKEGMEASMEDVLAVQKIYSDAKKGMEASEHVMKEIFQTTDVAEISKKIIHSGEIQLTTEYRERLRDVKRKRIIDFIRRNGVDPITHAPHPLLRIENAFAEARIHIDEFQPVNAQVDDAIKKLRPILPISFEVKEIIAKFSAEYGPKAYSVVSKFGSILKDEWLRDGSWAVVVEMPAGMEQEFYDKINKLTMGTVETKVLRIK